MRETKFRYEVDFVGDKRFFTGSKIWQQKHFRAISQNFSHVLIETVQAPFGPLNGRNVTVDTTKLLSEGVRVGMVCHGSEIRLPSRHMQEHEHSPFSIMSEAQRAKFERLARRNKQVLDRLGLPVFVSTPALLQDVPYATWLPVVIEPENWRNSKQRFQTAKPVVMHAPSRDVLKRSDLIDGPLAKLHELGEIDYRRTSGVAHSEMAMLLAEADILVDTVGTGNYGVAACEAMAAGCLVISYIPQRVREVVRIETSRELPIFGTAPDDVAGAVRRAIQNRESSQRLAAEGPSFVREVHDGRRSSEVLRPFLLGS